MYRTTLMLRFAAGLATCLLASGTTSSQIYVGARASFSIPRLSGGGDHELTRDYKSRTASSFAGMVDFNLRKRLSVQVEVGYAGHGGKRLGMQPITQAVPGLPALPPGRYYYAKFNNKAVLNYLEVPLMLKYRFKSNSRHAFFVNGGTIYGRLLNAHTETRGNSPIYLDSAGTVPIVPVGVSFDATTDIKRDLRSNNFGVVGGGGVEFGRGNNRFFIEGRAAYGLTVLQRDTTQNGSSHTGNLTMSFGYVFRVRRP